jgi:oligosaccharide repeat unit polymerase
MTLAISLVILAIAGLNRWIGKSVLYPPVLFSMVWAFSLFLVYQGGRAFFPIAGDTLLFYLWGVCAFAVGGALGLGIWSLRVVPGPPRCSKIEASRSDAIHRSLDALLLLLLIALPFYIKRLLDLASGTVIADFWMGIHSRLTDYGTEEGSRTVSLLDNCVVLSLVVAMVACREDDGTRPSRLRSVLAAAIALTYTLLRGERAGAIILLLGLLSISWIRGRKIKWKFLLVVTSAFFAVFFAIAFLLEKGYVERQAALRENVPALAQQVEWYAAGGVVAFDQVFHDPKKIPPVWGIDRTFRQAANKLGANFQIPSLHADFVDIGPEMFTNVYTFYFAYFPDFGMSGVTIILLILGLIASYVFQLAAHGNPIAQIVFGILFADIALSGFADEFFLGLNFLAKTLLFTYLLYRWRGLESLPRLRSKAGPGPVSLATS